MQYIVRVCRDEQLCDGQAHAFGKVAGEDVAKVAGGYGECDLGMLIGLERAEKGEVGGEVVCDLREDAGPIDGVYGGETVGSI